LDLDAVAALSRAASDVLDSVDTGDTPYDLEVSSPGVERPLTAEKHFRRARGRKAEVELADGTVVTGRLGSTADGVVDLVVRTAGDWTVRGIPLSEIRRAAVQVEFSRPSALELELAGMHETEAEA
jgi:ribosome maturation factor RimP